MCEAASVAGTTTAIEPPSTQQERDLVLQLQEQRDQIMHHTAELDAKISPLEEMRRDMKTALLGILEALCEAGVPCKMKRDEFVPVWYSANSWANQQRIPWNDAEKRAMTPQEGIQWIVAKAGACTSSSTDSKSKGSHSDPSNAAGTHTGSPIATTVPVIQPEAESAESARAREELTSALDDLASVESLQVPLQEMCDMLKGALLPAHQTLVDAGAPVAEQRMHQRQEEEGNSVTDNITAASGDRPLWLDETRSLLWNQAAGTPMLLGEAVKWISERL